MLRKILLISIPAVTIGLFVFIMNSSFIFKEPRGYSVLDHADVIQHNILSEDWGTVEKEINEMSNIVTQEIFPFIQFSVEKNEMIDFDLSISRIKGCIDAEDKILALVYLRELKNNWVHLNS